MSGKGTEEFDKGKAELFESNKYALNAYRELHIFTSLIDLAVKEGIYWDSPLVDKVASYIEQGKSICLFGLEGVGKTTAALLAAHRVCGLDAFLRVRVGWEDSIDGICGGKSDPLHAMLDLAEMGEIKGNMAVIIDVDDRNFGYHRFGNREKINLGIINSRLDGLCRDIESIIDGTGDIKIGKYVYKNIRGRISFIVIHNCLGDLNNFSVTAFAQSQKFTRVVAEDFDDAWFNDAYQRLSAKFLEKDMETELFAINMLTGLVDSVNDTLSEDRWIEAWEDLDRADSVYRFHQDTDEIPEFMEAYLPKFSLGHVLRLMHLLLYGTIYDRRSDILDGHVVRLIGPDHDTAYVSTLNDYSERCIKIYNETFRLELFILHYLCGAYLLNNNLMSDYFNAVSWHWTTPYEISDFTFLNWFKGLLKLDIEGGPYRARKVALQGHC